MRAHNLIIINTGNGKGKTTAALGLMWRALGHGLSCAVVQFIKKDPGRFGEYQFAVKQQVDWFTYGEGFTWDQEDQGPSAEAAREGWEFVKQAILDRKYDLLILDEFTYPVNEAWLQEHDVVMWLENHRDILPHLVITGRNASQQLMSLGNIVTEMKEITHCFSRQGIPAQKGIEF